MRIIFLQPRVVELTVDRRDARVTLFASQHAVAEHQYLGLPDREIPALPAKPFLDVTEICSGRIGTGVAGPMAAALSSTPHARRSEEHTSELQSLMRNSYAVFCLKQTKINH